MLKNEVESIVERFGELSQIHWLYFVRELEPEEEGGEKRAELFHVVAVDKYPDVNELAHIVWEVCSDDRFTVGANMKDLKVAVAIPGSDPAEYITKLFSSVLEDDETSSEESTEQKAEE